MKNIVLVGLSASGKTTIGNIITNISTNFHFVDTDELIVNEEKRSINKIFEENGEAYFRDIESKIVEQISLKSNCVISTGGGAILREQNINNLKKNGLLFYLKTSVKVLIERLKNDDTRPLLQTDDIEKKLNEMLKNRSKHYEKSDFTIVTDNVKPEDVSKKILRLYNKVVLRK